MKFLSKAFLFSTCTLLLTSGSLTARIFEDPRDPGNSPIDDAIDCMSETKVNYFRASPSTVNPFRSTTLSWDVSIPNGCPVSLKVAGKRVTGQRGSMSYTPITRNSYASLMATTIGGAAIILRNLPVRVNTVNCDIFPISINQVESQFIELLANSFEEIDYLYTKGDATIGITSGGLSLYQVIGVDIPGPNPSIKFDLGLRFTSRNGVVYPHWTKFSSKTSTYLPVEDFIDSKISKQKTKILTSIRNSLNENLKEILDLLYGTNRTERVFEVKTIQDNFEVAVCR